MKPKALQKILGHENIATTMDLYVHIDEQELAQEMKLIENVVWKNWPRIDHKGVDKAPKP